MVLDVTQLDVLLSRQGMAAAAQSWYGTLASHPAVGLVQRQRTKVAHAQQMVIFIAQYCQGRLDSWHNPNGKAPYHMT